MKHYVSKCNFISLIFFVCASVVVSSVATASTPIIDKRQSNQETRILQGIESGELNRRETKRLRKGQKQLRRMEHKVKSDGVITKGERIRLNTKAQHESQRIYRQKHDAQ